MSGDRETGSNEVTIPRDFNSGDCDSKCHGHSDCDSGSCNGDSDSECCIHCCCNCQLQRAKQRMRKEVVMERLRKKLKERQAHPGTDAASKRAKKMLRERLHSAKNSTIRLSPLSSVSPNCYDDAMLEIRESFPIENESFEGVGCEFELSTLRSELRLRAGDKMDDFFAKNAPETISENSSSETLSSSSMCDCSMDEEDFDAIFEPRKLDGLDPIERELECFKKFCQDCVPVRPRLKVPLVTLNLIK